jgi:hypothetical protein
LFNSTVQKFDIYQFFKHSVRGWNPKIEYCLKYLFNKKTGVQREKRMSNNYNGDSYSLAASYRLKLSSIALIVFLAIAAVCFYLKMIGVINDVDYYAVLFGLVVVALVLTFLFGKLSKKRRDSTIH